MDFKKIQVPSNGEIIKIDGNNFVVPDNPIIPYIIGDGIGSEITPVACEILDQAARATGRNIYWTEIYAGDKGKKLYNKLLPSETIKAIRNFKVALKGPLTTPVGHGYRSLNVSLRKKLDLYTSIRPAVYIEGLPTPLNNPEQTDIVVFRENTEDVYAGIEWERGSVKANKVRNFLNREMKQKISEDSGIGVKVFTEKGTKRLVRKAIDYALRKNRDLVTLVHKGNIMRYTEGAFCRWGYEVAKEEYGDNVVTIEGTNMERNMDILPDKLDDADLIVNDILADLMIQHLITETDSYDVLATSNLNGDYISDATAGLIGGLGVAPGSNVGDNIEVYEAVHGSAPDIAGEGKANPTAQLLSGALMFESFGWCKASKLIKDSVKETYKEKTVTWDIAQQKPEYKQVSTSKFGDIIAEKIKKHI